VKPLPPFLCGRGWEKTKMVLSVRANALQTAPGGERRNVNISDLAAQALNFSSAPPPPPPPELFSSTRASSHL